MRAVYVAMRASRTVPAGLVDAGCASLASFLVGLYAARTLPPAALGVYALFFTAFITAAIIPTQLIFAPAQIESLQASGPGRLRVLAQSLPFGSLPALLAAILASGAAVAASASGPASVVMPLALTTAMCTFVSPIQDHLRRMLHAAGRSWRAATVSIVQLTACAGALFVSWRADIPAAWVPFGALTMANLVSLCVGLFLAMESRAFPPLPRLSGRTLLRTGRWFVIVRLIPGLANFVSGVLVAHLAGAATLGYVEVTRVAGQPLVVLATGLSSVLGPQLMESGARRRPELGRPAARTFHLLVLACGVLYFAWVCVPWRLNPLPALLPNAYVVAGLLPCMLVAQVMEGLLPAYRSELTGARQGPVLVRREGSACTLQCLVSGSAGVTGAFAKPLGLLVQNTVAFVLLRNARDQLYKEAAEPEGLLERDVRPWGEEFGGVHRARRNQ